MKIIAIKKMSAGNESVGEMWDETAIFDESATVGEVLRWANFGGCNSTGFKNAILAYAQEPKAKP